MHDDAILVKYVDQLIIPLLCKVGLKPKVTRTAQFTTLKIPVRRSQ